MNTRNLFHNLTRGMKINQPLVNPHLISIPRLRPLTIRGLPRRNLQHLRRQSNGPLDFEILILCTSNQIRTHYN